MTARTFGMTRHDEGHRALEKQTIEKFGLNDREFEHDCLVGVTDSAGGFLPGVLQVGVDNSLFELQAKLDEEFARLVEDSTNLSSNACPPTNFTSLSTPITSFRTTSRFSISIVGSLPI